ncbi:MAG: hypothetical protein H0T60_08045 [Acidobacteria bacterium]|nr:hypothetical protein [Acidobacteriota bacterium]
MNDTTSQPQSKALAFLLTYILPAVLSAVVAAVVGFSTSFVGVRDSLITIRRDIEYLKAEVEGSKVGQEKFVSKEVQAETNRAVLSALDDLKQRTGRIEQTQVQILQRLPAVATLGGLAGERNEMFPFIAPPPPRPAQQVVVRTVSPLSELQTAALPSGGGKRLHGNRRDRRAYEAAVKRAFRRRAFSKFARRVAPFLTSVRNIKVV